tara:strand:- start:517 stop:5595 length:5079 start_codon:yes stop_codon:yes gene_type:complete
MPQLNWNGFTSSYTFVNVCSNIGSPISELDGNGELHFETTHGAHYAGVYYVGSNSIATVAGLTYQIDIEYKYQNEAGGGAAMQFYIPGEWNSTLADVYDENMNLLNSNGRVVLNDTGSSYVTEKYFYTAKYDDEDMRIRIIYGDCIQGSHHINSNSSYDDDLEYIGMSSGLDYPWQHGGRFENCSTPASPFDTVDNTPMPDDVCAGLFGGEASDYVTSLCADQYEYAYTTYACYSPNPDSGLYHNCSGGYGCKEIPNPAAAMIDITFDDWPQETTLYLRSGFNNTSGSYVWGIGLDVDNWAGGLPDDMERIVYHVPLDPGQYTFQITDSFGDGICCGYGSGDYDIYCSNSYCADGNGNFGYDADINLNIGNSASHTNNSSETYSSTQKVYIRSMTMRDIPYGIAVKNDNGNIIIDSGYSNYAVGIRGMMTTTRGDVSTVDESNYDYVYNQAKIDFHTFGNILPPHNGEPVTAILAIKPRQDLMYDDLTYYDEGGHEPLTDDTPYDDPIFVSLMELNYDEDNNLHGFSLFRHGWNYQMTNRYYIQWKLYLPTDYIIQNNIHDLSDPDDVYGLATYDGDGKTVFDSRLEPLNTITGVLEQTGVVPNNGGHSLGFSALYKLPATIGSGSDHETQAFYVPFYPAYNTLMHHEQSYNEIIWTRGIATAEAMYRAADQAAETGFEDMQFYAWHYCFEQENLDTYNYSSGWSGLGYDPEVLNNNYFCLTLTDVCATGDDTPGAYYLSASAWNNPPILPQYIYAIKPWFEDNDYVEAHISLKDSFYEKIWDLSPDWNCVGAWSGAVWFYHNGTGMTISGWEEFTWEINMTGYANYPVYGTSCSGEELSWNLAIRLSASGNVFLVNITGNTGTGKILSNYGGNLGWWGDCSMTFIMRLSAPGGGQTAIAHPYNSGNPYPLSLDLSWDEVPDVTGYFLYTRIRQDTGSGFSNFGSWSIAETIVGASNTTTTSTRTKSYDTKYNEELKIVPYTGVVEGSDSGIIISGSFGTVTNTTMTSMTLSFAYNGNGLNYNMSFTVPSDVHCIHGYKVIYTKTSWGGVKWNEGYYHTDWSYTPGTAGTTKTIQIGPLVDDALYDVHVMCFVNTDIEAIPKFYSRAATGSFTANLPGGGDGGNSCFAEGTLITMGDNSTENIEDLEVGDEILTYNNTIMKNESQQIKSIIDPVHTEFIKIYYTGLAGGFTTVTPDHPYLVVSSTDAKGQKTMVCKSYDPEATLKNYYIEATELEVGDTLLKDDGTTNTISSITAVTLGNTNTYRFNVQGNQSFYADHYLVHSAEADGEFLETEAPLTKKDGTFYAKVGNIETTTPWQRPNMLTFLQFRKDLYDLSNIDNYDVWLCGSWAEGTQDVWDIDVWLTLKAGGSLPSNKYGELGTILNDVIDLGLNTYYLKTDVQFLDGEFADMLKLIDNETDQTVNMYTSWDYIEKNEHIFIDNNVEDALGTISKQISPYYNTKSQRYDFSTITDDLNELNTADPLYKVTATTPAQKDLDNFNTGRTVADQQLDMDNTYPLLTTFIENHLTYHNDITSLFSDYKKIIGITGSIIDKLAYSSDFTGALNGMKLEYIIIFMGIKAPPADDIETLLTNNGYTVTTTLVGNSGFTAPTDVSAITAKKDDITINIRMTVFYSPATFFQNPYSTINECNSIFYNGKLYFRDSAKDYFTSLFPSNLLSAEEPDSGDDLVVKF